jgi:hypothetical protein
MRMIKAMNQIIYVSVQSVLEVGYRKYVVLHLPRAT